MSKKDGDDVSLDSGYGSDNESMAVPNKVSQVATERIKDIDALIGRLGGYKETFNAKTYAEEILQFNVAFMGVIEGLGAENFRENLLDNKIQQLVDAIALNSELCSKFISTNQQELDKLKLYVAKTEGALKGFVLPLEARSGPANKLTNFGLDRDEYTIPMEATKEALLELQGQNLTKVGYANKVVARTMEILKQGDQNFSNDKLQQFEDFVRQGDTSLKVKNDQLITRDNELSKLSQFDRDEISNAAIKSFDAFIKELETENEKARNTSLKQGRKIVPQKSMPQQDSSQRVSFGEQKTKDLQASKEMVSSIIDESIKQLKLKVPTNTADKIKNNLLPVLSKFDPQFLQENKTAIITNITHEITQDKTSFSELRKEVHIASDKVKKIAQKITKEYAKLNNQFIEEKIKPLLDVKKDELALRLSTFIQENQISLSSVNEMLGLSENNKINSDAKSLSLTDKQVEHITVKQLNGLIRVNPIGFNRNLFQEIPAEVKSVNVETEKVQQHNFEMGQRQDITEQVPQEVTNISAFEKEFKLAKETQVNNSVEVEKSTGIGVSDNVKEMVLSKQIIHKAIKLVEEGGKRKLDYSQQNKIIEKLSDKLSKLDIDYLKTEEQAIAKTIAKNIKKDASKSLFSNKITVSDKILTKYADDIEKSDGAKSDKIGVEVIVTHGSKSNEFAAKELKRGNMEISEKLVDHQVTNIPIKERISKLLATNEAANRWGVFNETVGLKNVIDKQLATLKKISPKEFDETASPKSDIAKITTKKQEQKLFPEIDLKEMGLKDITIKHTIKYIIMDADDKRVQKITPVRNKAKAIENQR